MSFRSFAVTDLDPARLAGALSAAVDGEVRFDQGTRAAYAQDGSNYRQVPIGVVLPHSIEAGVAAVEACREAGAPLLSRGGGTSLAGQCCNEAVVIDWTKYCHRLVSVDPESKTAVVEPGAVLDAVNQALAPYRLMVGPRPSTHVSCTIGGMIGNNSCGSTAQAYGKMADSVRRLDVLLYDGLRTWTGETSDEEYQRILASGDRKAEVYRGLREIQMAHLAEIRTGYPDIPRRVSGYNLDYLLPEKGFQVARALVGSESTLVTVLQAELDLVDVPRFRSLVVLGYPDIAIAADVVPLVVGHEPLAVEGLDDTLISLEREEHLASDALERLPEGSGWLMVQFGGNSKKEVEERARALINEASKDGTRRPHVAYLEDPAVEDELWDVREAGLGATAYPPGRPKTHEGWEDAAVPPERLGDYLRDFRRLLRKHDYHGASLYGHFGQGCVHTRIPFELRTDSGIAAYRSFAEQAADLVVSYGGSLSGEHGDGQSRGELLPRMFGPGLIRAFGELKAVLDPGNRMNPGKVVAPRRLDEDLTLHGWPPREPATFFSYPGDGGRFTAAASRCVGVGKCRGDQGGVMCPSYRVTREEEHATRGRARLLMEMVRGEVITEGWRSAEVRDALDLCLACKGCRKECPVDVDMATYKAEFLAHHYRGRLRPPAHYSMGWLPAIAPLASAPGIAGMVNAAGAAPLLGWLVKRAGGIDPRRELPRVTGQRFTRWYARQRRGGGEQVILWPDTFTNTFHPEVGRAALAVLEAAGLGASVPVRPVCCGLTWISTGQLGVARRVLARTLRVLGPALRAGRRIVVLEPSCAAVFRSDGPELLGTDDARQLARQCRTLAEVLDEEGWQLPGAPAAGAARRAIAQVHCHQHAIMGFDADQRLLRRCGVDLEVLDAGCCGLAGNFGFERGHYEVSVGCAERALWPAVRDAAPDTAVLADGFSCRTQIGAGHLGRSGIHLAQLLAGMLAGGESQPRNGGVPG
jgi:FAD/FMN-containing dehydrogenase/Fe-S oxidoreductase